MTAHSPQERARESVRVMVRDVRAREVQHAAQREFDQIEAMPNRRQPRLPKLRPEAETVARMGAALLGFVVLGLALLVLDAWLRGAL